MADWLDHMRGLLGKEVVIVLNREPLATAVGELLSFDTGGEVVLRDEEGFVHYCWPALEASRKPEAPEPMAAEEKPGRYVDYDDGHA